MKSTLHGFVWPAGVMALKFMGATNPILFVGNIAGAAYTFKDIPEMIYNYFKKDKEKDTDNNEKTFDYKKENTFLASIMYNKESIKAFSKDNTNLL